MTQDGKTALVKYFFDKQIDEYIGVAYIDAQKYFILICLYSKTQIIFFNSLKPFSKIVKSCEKENIKVIDLNQK